jgi:cytochrome c oxidase subunit IV
MLTWCAILFILGILAFLDTIFSYGEIFRRVNSVVFMLVSLGLLVRTSMKMKVKRIEGLIAKVEELEAKLAQLKANAEQPSKTREKETTY